MALAKKQRLAQKQQRAFEQRERKRDDASGDRVMGTLVSEGWRPDQRVTWRSKGLRVATRVRASKVRSTEPSKRIDSVLPWRLSARHFAPPTVVLRHAKSK
jgi:hypothetical protein